MRTCLSRPAAPAALVLCVLVAAGCASIVTPPVDVTLARVELADFAVLEQRLNLSLRFVNRGDHDVAVDGLDFTLDINGLPFAGGVSAQAFSIPRYGETTVQVMAVSNLSAVLRQLSEVNGRLGGATAIPAALSYRIHGRANAGLFGLAFDTQSELPFPIAPG